ncbi:MAG: 23S rRNA (pseudouridine(1915)-N(3))-methyltransferase RlmH [Clostridia bacterium]|nr:23S rRNA (pseudouridine(1915)-N(3))-methyltransferase RlmH [Clostridia bacterium]
MQVTIIYVGNIKDKFLADAVAEYEKRLSAYCKIQNIELKESKVPENASDAEVQAAITEEGKRILNVLPKKSYKIALAVEGKELSSTDFAKKIAKSIETGNSQITFIIGGAFGMSEEVKSACDFRLSVSKMTFTHRMMRFILLEQVYRAFNINAGGKYHK